jgi:membrane-associated phospholipid phosphatase
VNFHRKSWLPLCAAVLACIARTAAAQEASSTSQVPDEQQAPGLLSTFGSDLKAYFLSPLHWNSTDWLYFGGTVAAVAASHHYDDQVRTHFTTGQYASNLTSPNPHNLQDAAPAVAVVGATWFFAGLFRDNNGHRETAEMLEAGALSSASAFLLKSLIRRQGPDVTADSSQFGGGTGSFPSLHATAAFSIGTVLAESGNDDVRWIRRLLGYGLGAFTSYERLKHNAHWLSDTVAGAGLGIATGHFVMNRHKPPDYSSSLSIVPINGGVMLTFSKTLPP